MAELFGNKKRVPLVSKVKAAGTQILVEKIDEEELLPPTTLTIPDGSAFKNNGEAYQGYIRDIGPRVDEEMGFKVGDRIAFSGFAVPLPAHGPYKGSSKRDWILLEPHAIRAILEESAE